MASTYVPIQTYTLGSNTNTVTFTVLPSTYTDLVVICNWVENSTEDLCVRVGNGSVSTSGYSLTYLWGNGSSAGSGRASTSFWDVSQLPASTTQPATTFMNFMSYANTNTYKTMLSRSGAAPVGVISEVALWSNTSAIERIELRCGYGTNTFNAGSTFTVYGIKAA